MCLRVFVGSEVELPEVPSAGPAVSLVRLPATEEPVRAILGSAHAYEAGAHTGCACGFNSGGPMWEGRLTSDDVQAWLGAMTDEERSDFEAEQGSRVWLRGVLEAASVGGRARAYACWWGDEAAPVSATRSVALAWFDSQIQPFAERVLYEVLATGCPAAPPTLFS